MQIYSCLLYIEAALLKQSHGLLCVCFSVLIWSMRSNHQLTCGRWVLYDGLQDVTLIPLRSRYNLIC